MASNTGQPLIGGCRSERGFLDPDKSSLAMNSRDAAITGQALIGACRSEPMNALRPFAAQPALRPTPTWEPM